MLIAHYSGPAGMQHYVIMPWYTIVKPSEVGKHNICIGMWSKLIVQIYPKIDILVFDFISNTNVTHGDFSIVISLMICQNYTVRLRNLKPSELISGETHQNAYLT